MGNAEIAYQKGLLPASKIKRIPVALIKKWARVSEVCPTGDFQVPTNFYNHMEVKGLFGLIKDPRYPEDVWASLDLKDFKKTKFTQIHQNCLVKWLEWDGNLTHPKATKRVEIGCKVTVRGQFAYIETPSKESLKKKLSTKGFSFRVIGTESSENPLRNFGRSSGRVLD